jgi:hypothetical protein
MWPAIVPFVIVALFATQIAVGYRYMCHLTRWPTCRAVHRTVAVAIGIVFLWHDTLPLLWLRDPTDLFRTPLVMPAGLLVFALLGFEYLVGFRLVDFRRRFRVVHFTIAWTILALGMLHGAGIVAGYGTPMTGDCAGCHRPPPQHSAITCAACHRHPGIAW